MRKQGRVVGVCQCAWRGGIIRKIADGGGVYVEESVPRLQRLSVRLARQYNTPDCKQILAAHS